jgi:pilus assembly protein CpaB
MKRLTPATVTFLMFGVVGLLVAAYVGKSLLATEPPRQPGTQNMPMPVSDIPAGTLIRAEHLGLGAVLVSEMEPDMLMREAIVVGRVARKDLPKARPIYGRDLYEFGVTPALDVADGMRAITLVAGDTPSLVDGLIKPGEYVDVLFKPSDVSDRRYRGGVVATLLKGIKVLAINRQFRQGQPEDSNTLPLELTPEEASVVSLAQSHGDLMFQFNPEGKGENIFSFRDPERITLEEVLGIPAASDAAEPFRANLYRQSSRQEFEFDKGNRVTDGSGDYVPMPTLPDRNLDQRVAPRTDTPAAPVPATPAPTQASGGR